MFCLIDSPLPNEIYSNSATFLAQIQAAYCTTLTSNLRAIKKSNERILEMHKIL